MDFVETFHGQEITVTTTRAVDGRWTAAARYVVAPGQSLHVVAGASTHLSPTTYATEDQAKAAALESAAAAIDRARSAIGKP